MQCRPKSDCFFVRVWSGFAVQLYTILQIVEHIFDRSTVKILNIGTYMSEQTV